jgi:hypothetical protein
LREALVDRSEFDGSQAFGAARRRFGDASQQSFAFIGTQRPSHVYGLRLVRDRSVKLRKNWRATSVCRIDPTMGTALAADGVREYRPVLYA